MREKEKEKNLRQLYLILYGILWFLVLSVAGAMAWQKQHDGNATIYSAMEAVGQFKLFYWLIPSTWGTCLKYSAVYWTGVALFIIYEQKFRHDAAGIEAGSAHWNDRVEEFNETHNEPFGGKTFDDTPNRPHGSTDSSWQEGKINHNNPGAAKPVPGNPNMIESATVRLSIADQKTRLNNNVAIIGGAGSGKSRFFIKPNILQMNSSFVVTDPSGELLASTHNVLVENGYRIKVFNLDDMTHSCKYNPFRYIKKETDVSIMVDCFMSNTTSPDQRSGDPFWDKSEKALLSALIFYLVDVAEPEFRTFSTILWMVQQAQMDENGNMGKAAASGPSVFGFSMDTPLDSLFNGTKKIVRKTARNGNGKIRKTLEAVDVTDPEEIKKLQEDISASLCLVSYKTFKLGGVKTLKSILISAAVRLDPFSRTAIRNLTSDDNVELETTGDVPTAFFAIIPQASTSFNFLISMLFSQMFEALYDKGNGLPGKRLNYHIRFLLDEFANIGKIPEFPEKISTCRKYNISVTIVLQSLAQIKMLYKDHFETILANCDTTICLGTNEQTTADYFSKKLGKRTITSRGKSTQIGKSGGSMSFNPTGRELMMPDEIMTMPYDECIVMMNHVSPFYDKKYPLETHPQYQYTGDASKKNLYLLNQDDTFLCEDLTEECSEAAVQEEFSRENEPYKPRTLEEVLGDLLKNNPAEDGYFLVKDADPKKEKSYMNVTMEQIWETIKKCDDEKWQTVFYDGKTIDPLVVEPVLNMVMNDITAPVQAMILAYDPFCGEGHSLKGAAKKGCKNITEIFDGLRLRYDIQEGSRHDIYRGQENAGAEKLDKIRRFCKDGTGKSSAQEDEDEWGDYRAN